MTRRGKDAISTWRRLPLLVSVVFGGLLFGVVTLLLPSPRGQIVVDARTVRSVVERRADLLGRDLTPEERAEAIQDHIDEAILVREAYRRGLDRSSGSVRARLLRRMRLAINTEVLPPTPAQMRAFYSANSDRYGAPLVAIEDFVRMDWMLERRAEITERKLSRMMDRYLVDVDRSQ